MTREPRASVLPSFQPPWVVLQFPVESGYRSLMVNGWFLFKFARMHMLVLLLWGLSSSQTALGPCPLLWDHRIYQELLSTMPKHIPFYLRPQKPPIKFDWIFSLIFRVSSVVDLENILMKVQNYLVNTSLSWLCLLPRPLRHVLFYGMWIDFWWAVLPVKHTRQYKLSLELLSNKDVIYYWLCAT